MFTISIPMEMNKIFETTLEPIEDELKDRGEGDIKGFMCKENKVAVGIPYFENITDRLANNQSKLSAGIKSSLYEYDYHFVSVSCSFRPDKNCKFTSARFGINLNSQLNDKIGKKPIAIELFPEEVTSKIYYKKQSSLQPSLKINLLNVAKAEFRKEMRESSEYVIYEPHIVGYGKNRSNVSWDFSETREKGIWGIKDIFLIIKAIKESKVKGKFVLGGTIQSQVGGISIPFTTRKADKAVEEEYLLSK